MMNRNSSNYSIIGGGRNLHTSDIYNAPVTGLLSHRRVMSFSTATTATTEDLSKTNVHVRLERLSAGSTKPAKSILDDLLSSDEGGKHDYDWLLIPPETPLLPSSNGKECQPKSVAPPSVRSGSTNRISRHSVSQSESNHPSKPARSSSVTRPSISTTQNTNRNSNILNTSSASVSYIRPSTPTNHSPSAARPSTASSRTTPSRSHPSTTTSIDRTIRPSTPTPRPQSPSFRPVSRPSTPSNKRRVGLISRPSSPISWVKDINLPELPNVTPPNLITSVPERPMSAGRSRPCAAMTVKRNVENNTRRQSPPIVNKGRLANGHLVESITRKPIKVLNSESGTGFGRSISKKSLDLAIKNMDIRTEGTRSLSGPTLFPHSIRSGHGSSASNNLNSKYGYSKLTQTDVYESLRYDSIVLKEDLMNTSWLHSGDEKSDQCPLFDNGFEPLPEPFAPL